MPGLMALTRGRADVVVWLLDGPVALDHPDLMTANRTLGEGSGACRGSGSEACRHGIFVAGILGARRGPRAPAIAPGCTPLVRPIFNETGPPGKWSLGRAQCSHRSCRARGPPASDRSTSGARGPRVRGRTSGTSSRK